MIDPRRIRHKGLRQLWLRGDTSRLNADHVGRLKRILAALNAAVSPDELRMPGYRWHRLIGDRKDTYSVKVSGNWRLTYQWDDDGPYDIKLEDYHGN